MLKLNQLTNPVDDWDGLYQFLLVPGLGNSSEEHWQSYWHQQFPDWLRITQKNWKTPDIHGWGSAIKRSLSLLDEPQKIILIGHSFGALASLCYSFEYPEQIAMVVVVAPANPAKFEVDDALHMTPLVPVLMFASHNDVLMDWDNAEKWAHIWQAHRVDMGDAGHINAESGFGKWPWGLNYIRDYLMQTLSPSL
ncbi:RBBP9/YdeN family alpha/beta hydrolase [Celerinatantimonas yamalensis]|uniref:Alpha/beta fold hydrolase n=1 Tax=Celerinatantimonas yamalensis TaxID=559956 RepID=A0ABW9GAX7_9GAMM